MSFYGFEGNDSDIKYLAYTLLNLSDDVYKHIDIENDILLFLGQSLNYLYHVMKIRHPNLDAYELEFSGRPKLFRFYEPLNDRERLFRQKHKKLTGYNDYDIETPLQIYKTYLESIGINKSLFDSGKNIVLLDYISTGISMNAFIFTLQRLFCVELNKIKIVAIADEHLNCIRLKKQIKSIKFIILNDLDGNILVNDALPRTIQYRVVFPGLAFGEESNKYDLDFSVLDKVKYVCANVSNNIINKICRKIYKNMYLSKYILINYYDNLDYNSRIFFVMLPIILIILTIFGLLVFG